MIFKRYKSIIIKVKKLRVILGNFELKRMLFEFLQKGCIILLLHIKYVKTQESQWFGFPNLKDTYIAEFNAPNEGYIINKICMGNESIIDNIGDVSFTNEYNTYNDKHFYGSNTTIESCFESSSCINSVKITIGNYNSYDVITALAFKSDNNNEESFGGNNLYNPPRGSYYFNCQTGYCLSKITTKYNPYIHAIKFDCDVIRTMQPTKIPTKLCSDIYRYIVTHAATFLCIYFYVYILMC